MAERPTEARHPSSDQLHARPAAEVLSRLFDAQAASLQSVRAAMASLEQAAELAAAALLDGGRMAYAGAGSSGLMALADCLELAGTFGIPPERTPMLFAGGAAALMHMTGGVEDDLRLAAGDLGRAGLGRGDVVICVSASGTTPYTLAVAEGAKARGAGVIGIANAAGKPLLQVADVAVCLDTGPEVIAGSTRMAAATAQKVALNMMSVLIGIRLGAVHDGYMVEVVADNAKLIDRAARIVAAISGTGTAAARVALNQAGGAVKPAVLIARGAPAHDAQALLAAAGGHLGKALAALDG